MVISKKVCAILTVTPVKILTFFESSTELERIGWVVDLLRHTPGQSDVVEVCGCLGIDAVVSVKSLDREICILTEGPESRRSAVNGSRCGESAGAQDVDGQERRKDGLHERSVVSMEDVSSFGVGDDEDRRS